MASPTDEPTCTASDVDRDRVATIVEQSLMLGAALAPHIGYDAAAKLAKEAYESGRTIRELAGAEPAPGRRARPHPRRSRHDRARSLAALSPS